MKIFRLNIAILEFNISTFFFQISIPKKINLEEESHFITAFHYDFAVFIGFQMKVFGLNYIVTIILSWEIYFSTNKNKLYTIYKSLDCKILSHLSNSCSIGSLQNVDLLSPLQQRAAEVVGMYLQLYGKWVNLIGISLSCKHHRAQERTS